MIKYDKRKNNNKSKKNNKKISFLTVIACVSLIGFFIYTMISLSASIQLKKAKKNELVQKIETEKKKGEDLKEEIATIGTDKFIEKHARDVFGYVKEDEKVFYDINNN
jgi:cell division protein FtsB